MKKIKATGITTPPLSFNNSSFKVKTQSFTTPLGFSLSSVDMFSHATDAKINSYSAMVLSNKKGIENTLEILTDNPLNGLVNNTDPKKYVYLAGSLRFPSSLDGVDAALYLKALKGEDNIWRTSWSDIEGSGTGFAFEFRNQREVSIYFKSENIFYYLNSDGIFTAVYSSFVPVWNPEIGLLSLILPATFGNYLSAPAITTAQLNTVIPPVILKISETGGNFIGSGIIGVTPLEFFNTDISSRWNEYEKTQNRSNQSVSLDSLSGIETSFVATMEYNTVDESGLKFNLIQTKDILDRTNIQGRNSYLLKGDPRDEVNHRFYTGLFTGIEDEKGLNSPILSYINLSSVVNASAGAVSTFLAPDSMGPFTRLNINDTTFFESGAIAGENPILSDKVYKKRKNYVSSISDDATGVYLCTWLYTSDNGSTAVWLDRYYNPIMRKSADSIYDAVSTVTTVVEQASAQDAYVAALIKQGYFDKQSDLSFEPNAEYQYYRLDETLFGTYIDNVFASSLLDTQPAPAIRDVSNTDAMKKYIDAFTFSIELSNTDWSRRSGHTMFTNKNGEGFALYNDVYSNTYIAVNLGDKIQILNTKFEEIYLIYPKDVWGSLGPKFKYVYSHGLGDYMLVLLDNGFMAKISFEGEVRESLMLANINVVGHSFDYASNTVSLFTDTGLEYEIDWFNLSHQNVPTSIQQRINFDNKTLEVFSDHIEIAGELMDDINLDDVTIKAVAVGRNNDIVVLHNKLSGTAGYIAIFDSSKRLIKLLSSPLYFIASNIELVSRSNGDFILITIGNVLYELDYSGKQTNLYDFSAPVLRSNLSATTALRNYFGNLLVTDMVFDYRVNYYGSTSAGTLYDKVIVPFGDLPPGKQFTSFVFDSLNGVCKFSLNGFKVYENEFDAGVFSLKNGFKTQFTFGTPLVGYSNRIQTYINEMPYIRTNDILFSAYSLYSKAATDGQILSIMKRNLTIPDIHLLLPFGFRSEIEETRVFYRMGIPGRKDSRLDVKIKGIEGLNNLDTLLSDIGVALNNENPISTSFSISNG